MVYRRKSCYLHGMVNKQNHRILGTENPYEYRQKPLHSPYVTVWMGISASGMVGPFFINGRVCAENYSAMLTTQVFPALEKHNWLNGFTWQQDGATAQRKKHQRNHSFDLETVLLD